MFVLKLSGVQKLLILIAFKKENLNMYVKILLHYYLGLYLKKIFL